MNPEFVRNTWLELTPLRRWALPLVAIALAVVVGAYGSPRASNWDGIVTLGLALYAVFALWGAAKAAGSVTGEITSGTWDLQRLAEHRPLELLVGKLFGSTVFEWLGIACGIALFSLGSAFAGAGGSVALSVLTLVLGALALHGIGLLLSLAGATGLRATRRPTRGNLTTGAIIVLLLLGIWSGPPLLRAGTASTEAAIRVDWWWQMPLHLFVPLSLAFLVLWTLVGAHRLMRAELQEPVTPAPWLGCLLFLILYFTPFVPAQLVSDLGGPAGAFFATAAVVCGLFMYLLLFGERKDVVTLRGLAAAWARRDGRAVWRRTPLWALTFAGFALSVAMLAGVGLLVRAEDAVVAAAIGMSLGLFMLRDVGWILAVHVTPDLGRRPDMVVLFFTVVLYGLAPLLMSAIAMFNPALLVLLPVVPVVDAAKASAGAAVAATLWALPGSVVAWAIAYPRLRRALKQG